MRVKQVGRLIHSARMQNVLCQIRSDYVNLSRNIVLAGGGLKRLNYGTGIPIRAAWRPYLNQSIPDLTKNKDFRTDV